MTYNAGHPRASQSFLWYARDTRKNLIEASRDIGQRITRVVSSNGERATTFACGDVTINDCPVLLFLDGVLLGDTEFTDVDSIISTTSLSAVEAY